MITLEKLLLLKSVTFFKQTSDELLMQIASTSTTEHRVNAGELIIEKGSASRDMYVIVSGKVKVHDNPKIISLLGEREIFGELSALSLQPRVLSVSAVQECLLLKINGLALYEIMSFDIGLAKGIIQALCDRERTIAKQLYTIMHEK